MTSRGRDRMRHDTVTAPSGPQPLQRLADSVVLVASGAPQQLRTEIVKPRTQGPDGETAAGLDLFQNRDGSPA